MKQSNYPQPASADTIKLARSLTGLTQAQAAEVVYASVRTWQKWEQGEREMPLSAFALFRIKTGGEVNASTYNIDEDIDTLSRGDVLVPIRPRM